MQTAYNISTPIIILHIFEEFYYDYILFALLTALSCNKFVYNNVGSVIGMRRFKASLEKTPGMLLFQVNIS